MVKMGIARSRNHAYSIIIRAGLPKALELIKREEEVKKLTEKFLREGIPYENPPTAEDVEESRER